MRCARIRRWLSAQLDEQLSPSREARLARHLEACRACARYRESLAAGEQRIKALASPATSPDFYARVRMKLAREAEASRAGVPAPAWSRPRWAAQLALLVLGLLPGGLVGFLTSGRFVAAREQSAQRVAPPTDEFVLFAAVPAATTEDDLFRGIVYEDEVSTP
jgi:anti-sigma factor RsiW